MVGDFLAWWGQQLLSLSPAQARAGHEDAVLASLRRSGPDAGAGSVDVAVRRRTKATPLGAFPLTESGMAALRNALGSRRPHAELVLPAGMVLEHAVTLPLAAERDPESVLRFEMDRLTPFAANELYWTWAADRRDRARSQLHLRLVLVLRAQVDAALGMLRLAGLHPSALADAGGRRIPLDPARTGAWRRRLAAVLAAACVLLALAAIAIPFAGQSRDARRIEQQIAALRAPVDRAEALRRSMSTAAAGVDVLATERAKRGDPLAILTALTDILPDDTVLTDLTLRQRVITITGQSATAARLIAALAADPAIRNPTFTAPVTRNETAHADVFSIRAEAASQAEAASAAQAATRRGTP